MIKKYPRKNSRWRISRSRALSSHRETILFLNHLRTQGDYASPSFCWCSARDRDVIRYSSEALRYFEESQVKSPHLGRLHASRTPSLVHGFPSCVLWNWSQPRAPKPGTRVNGRCPCTLSYDKICREIETSLEALQRARTHFRIVNNRRNVNNKSDGKRVGYYRTKANNGTLFSLSFHLSLFLSQSRLRNTNTYHISHYQ